MMLLITLLDTSTCYTTTPFFSYIMFNTVNLGSYLIHVLLIIQPNLMVIHGCLNSNYFMVNIRLFFIAFVLYNKII